MTTEILDRAMVREQAIWPSFAYEIPDIDIEIDKNIIFGLYANSYLHGHNYLEDIAAEELQRIVDTYDSNMAELATEEQILVLQIASNRYLKVIEIQIKDNALITKTQQLDKDEQEYEARLAALDIDRESLETMGTQIALEINRAELKNKDLEVKIQLEEIAQEYVAVEISQKQLEAGRAELQVLLAAFRGLEIQLDIANTSYQIVDVEASKAQLNADKKEIEVQITILETSKQTYDAEILSINVHTSEIEYSKKQYEVDVVNINTQIAELELSKKEITSEKDNINLQTEEAELLKIEYNAKIADIDMQIAKLEVSKQQYSADISTMNTQIAKFEASKSQLTAEIAGINADIEDKNLSSMRLEVDNAEFTAMQFEVDSIASKRIELIEARGESIKDETLNTESLGMKEHNIQIARISEQNAINQSTIASFADRESAGNVDKDQSRFNAALDKDISGVRKTAQIAIATKREELSTARVTAAGASSDAAIMAAEILATADIINTLTHQIKPL